MEDVTHTQTNDFASASLGSFARPKASLHPINVILFDYSQPSIIRMVHELEPYLGGAKISVPLQRRVSE